MKAPIRLTACILAIGATIAWFDHLQLKDARESRSRTLKEAALRDLSVDLPGDPPTSPIPRRNSQDRSHLAKLLATEYIGLFHEKKDLKESGSNSNTALEERESGLSSRMESLNANQWLVIIAEISSNSEISDRDRSNFFYRYLPKFADLHPQAALEYFDHHRDLLIGTIPESMVARALISWSKDDPVSATDWIQQNLGADPDLVTEATKSRMASVAAFRDPRLAFQLIHDLKCENPSAAAADVIIAANTTEKQTEMLHAFRHYLDALDDDRSRQEIRTRGIRALTHQVCLGGFSTASQWIDSAELTPGELDAFTAALSNHAGIGEPIQPSETGHWIEWIADKVPSTTGERQIRSLLTNWTLSDHQSAGNWLSSLAEGDVRNLSVQTFAQTVAPYEPNAAAQWAMTLPPGDSRDTTLTRIFQQWPKDDPQGAAAFANEHGLSE